MEQFDRLPELLDRPAFCVEDGIITALNPAARGFALSEGMSVSELLTSGWEAYGEFTAGCLSLELSLPGGTACATVTALDRGRLFTLEPETAGDDLRLLSLAAQALREPLSDVMALVDSLPSSTLQRPEITRGLHRLLRIVGNMTPQPAFRPEMTELNALLREVWDQAQPACEATGLRFTFIPSPAPVYTSADGRLLARAIHNLLSNSMKFSPGSQVRLELLRSSGTCRIRYFDPGASLPPEPFTRYLREPGLEDSRRGLGMGLHLVRTAAAAHGGTVLMTAPKGGGVLTEMHLPIRQDTPLRSPQLRISYTGEWDPLLVELSDVLPPEFYQ